MAINSKAILAGTGGVSLAWFAPSGTAGPTGADPSSTALAAAYLDAGLVSDSGLVGKVNESSNQVYAYGNTAPVRTLVSQRSTEFDITFLESNPVSLAVYNRKALGSISPTASSGAFTVATGGASLPLYTAVFDMVDGNDHIRMFCPSVAATAVQGITVAPGSPVQYGVTLTTYPDATGNAVYFYYLVNALKTS